jgi:rSAM/selenodomain-associated transferase 1
MHHSSHALLIFIKNPERGKVKTRLAATVGDERALRIYRALLKYTRNLALEVASERYLFYSRFIEENDEWSSRQFHKKLQEGEDLGERMYRAFAVTLGRHGKAVIIGSDCPTLTPAIVEEAFRRLDDHDYVIGPARDGGYYLLGMRELRPELFRDIPWSTDQVRSLTIDRIKERGQTYFLLPELSDIDRAEDWEEDGWEL